MQGKLSILDAKAGISPDWQLFGDIGECPSCEIIQIFSKHSTSIPERSTRQTFSVFAEFF